MELSQKKTLATALSYVYGYFDLDRIPEEIEDTLQAVSYENIKGLTVKEVGNYGTYPYHEPSVVCFDNGTFHYVDAPADRTILDSSDGLSKRMDVYGVPVSWATFELADVPLHEKPDPETGKMSGEWVKLAKNQSIWQLALKKKLNAEELIEHNGFDRPHELEAGTPVHLPTSPKQNGSNITYEILPAPATMHTNKDTKKWSFGAAKKWKDLATTERTIKANTNVDIVAIAYVDIEGTKAGYYMDSHALGKTYNQNGRVAYSIGYNHADLAEGEYTPEIEKPSRNESGEGAVETIVPESAIEDIATPQIPTETHERPIYKLPDNDLPNVFKSTYADFPEGERFLKLIIPEPHDAMLVEDFSRGKQKEVYTGMESWYKGTFFFEGLEYARPTTAVENGRFWGVPVSMLVESDTLYTHTVDPQKQKQSLSTPEAAFTYVARGVSKVNKMSDYLNKRIAVKQKGDIRNVRNTKRSK